MQTYKITPIHLLTGAVLLMLVMAGLSTYFAVQPQWLGLRLAFDEAEGGAVVTRAKGPAAHIPQGTVLTTVSGNGKSMRLVARDFLSEPDGNLPSFADYDAFLARQGELDAIQSSPEVIFEDKQGSSWTITPHASRPITDLPAPYWVPLIVGIFAWLISACIWVFRTQDVSARYLLLTGWATLMFSPFAAIYATRELGMNETVFRVFSDLNFMGGNLFIAALIALLLYYPRPIAPRWAGLAVVALFMTWFTAQQFGAFDNMVLARRLLVMIGILASFVLAGYHWYHTRNDPVGRASLQWFLLSWLMSITIFSTIIFVPQIFGIDTSALQGFSFSLFLLLYAGLAFGIVRFRLFELGEWWARVVTWMISIILLIMLDLVFLLGMQLSSGLSLSLALLICGLIWLPLRGFFWTRFLGGKRNDERSNFKHVLEIAFAADPEAQAKQWIVLLQNLFDPLEIKPVTTPVDAVSLEQDGLALRLPMVGAIPALELAYANAGSRLFTRRDRTLAQDLADMLSHAIDSRNSYEKGAGEERKRIASDIHDNVGASLLNALHSSSDNRKDQLIRETIADLRGIINNAAAPDISLGEALAHIRRETADRLEANGITLDWPLLDEADEALTPGPALVHALRSIVREAVSNIVRHAGAKQARIALTRQGEMLSLVIEDDGKGLPASVKNGGNGLSNIKSRATAQGGEVAWTSPAMTGASGAGTRLEVTLPLPRENAA